MFTYEVKVKQKSFLQRGKVVIKNIEKHIKKSWFLYKNIIYLLWGDKNEDTKTKRSIKNVKYNS